jgi:hypothetical protein
VSPGSPAPGGAWDIGAIETRTGKIVFAPRGTAIPDVPAIPFSGRTRLVDGRLAFTVDGDGSLETVAAEAGRPVLSLSIPEGDYPLRAFNLDLDADLIGLRGEVAFNLPIGQEQNNLVETLTARRVQFEQFAIDDAFLAVTYDEAGVYAKFGGAAYGGYLNGAFNIYLEHGYPWDGWATGTGIDLDGVTRDLTPTYLEMTGIADCKLIAQGDLQAPENITARAEFSVRDGGQIDVVALGDLADSLPEPLAPLQRKLAEVGLGVLEHFTYDTAEITSRISGREGVFNLDLRGPSGSRAVEIVAHDHRYRRPGAGDVAADSGR